MQLDSSSLMPAQLTPSLVIRNPPVATAPARRFRDGLHAPCARWAAGHRRCPRPSRLQSGAPRRLAQIHPRRDRRSEQHPGRARPERIDQHGRCVSDAVAIAGFHLDVGRSPVTGHPQAAFKAGHGGAGASGDSQEPGTVELHQSADPKRSPSSSPRGPARESAGAGAVCQRGRFAVDEAGVKACESCAWVHPAHRLVGLEASKPALMCKPWTSPWVPATPNFSTLSHRP